ncbi:MAG TPA: exopolysaccharide biosynthesis polyprenyl glycosylphosphotransferase [Candidatus Paceibacterota bacterium]|nr:exopolysaccharide biosynthesis polyprenyl glycosylphosphotransferase [Candidatus Paceibacterota bacterium]
MTGFQRNEPILLFLGDVVAFLISLWLTLAVRYLTVPSSELFFNLLLPFAILFFVWVVIFFISGLYEKHTVLLKSKLPNIILNAQVTNSLVAVLFFYFIPYFGVTPKTTLFIYLIISFCLILLWRIKIASTLGFKNREPALLIGSGPEVDELIEEINNNNRYNLYFVSFINLDRTEIIDFQVDILDRIYTDNISVVVIDLRNKKIEPLLPRLYNLIFSNIRFIDKYKIYEDIFDRVPYSLLQYNWFLENISTSSKLIYDTLKRLFDIVLSLIFGLISLIFYPFVYVAIKIEDGGPVFIVQERIGQGGRKINLLKFRSMKSSDRGMWVVEKDDRVTRVGKFLRKTRIDELPQLWNVLIGDISLIGPRPDIYDLGLKLAKEIPYYTIRSIIKPGLSGWAQIKQDLPPQSLEETKIRLVYDLYYVKNRSIILDIKIILQTLKTLVSRSGL